MASYEVGYRKPPLSGRFRAGVSGNPKARPKREPNPLAERIKTVLNAPIEHRERGRTKVASYRELSLKVLVDRAVRGDLGAAELALKIRLAPSATAIQASTRSWSRTGSLTIPIRPPTKRPPTSRPGGTPNLPNGGRRRRTDRKAKVRDVRSANGPRASHIARTTAYGSVKGSLGLVA
jgi:hypothetical protein